MVKVQGSERQPESGSLQFEIDAGLLFQLGEQLVARRSIALAELVKNAYDADATKVTVLLENVTHPYGTIIVEDNGTGMTFEQVRDHWMRIATDDKVRNPISPVYGRPRTGAKGIGRFAARRLANKLILHSVARRDDGIKEKIVVEFDWKERFKPGQTLTEIPVTYERKIVDNSAPTGVMLYLEDARDVWDEEDIIELQRDLLSLVTPFPQDSVRPPKARKRYRSDPGFSMRLEVPEFPKYEGELGDQFLAAAWGKLRGYIDKKGTPRYHLDIRMTEESLDFVPEEERFEDLIGARFRIHFFVYKSDYLRDFDFGVRDAQRMGREQGGVRIYLDGFRVFPFGDPGDDWLKLDEVRAGRTGRLIIPPEELQLAEDRILGRPWLLTPGNNQVFGIVAISQHQHRGTRDRGIQINVSRERLVENEAFYQLRHFVQLGIYWMTIQYARVTAEERAARKKIRRPSVPEIIDQAQDVIRASEELVPESQREILHVLDYAKERAQAEEEEHISELAMLRVLATTGTMINMMNHQLRAVVDGIRAIQTDLSELRPHVMSKARDKFDEIVRRIRDWREMVTRQVSQLGFILGPDTRVRRRRLALREVMENVTNPLSLYMRDFGIELRNEVPANLRTPPVFEAELHAVLLSLFSNALKAVRDKEVSKITVKASEQDDGLHIFMLDTGVGIEPERREEVFKPFVTTSTPDLILGVGTGLGLKVVRDILETYGGTARFIDVEEPWKTCIEIILPRGG